MEAQPVIHDDHQLAIVQVGIKLDSNQGGAESRHSVSKHDEKISAH
jgi:hypothetical protein